MRRFKQQLTNEECVNLLKSVPRGVLALLGDDGYPYTVPLDFYFDEENGNIYFHGAKEGHKVDAIKKEPKCSFCVMGDDYKKEGDWAWMVKSVVAFGKIRLMDYKTEKLAINELLNLGMKYYLKKEDVDKVIEETSARIQMFELTVEHMAGKLVHEQ